MVKRNLGAVPSTYAVVLFFVCLLCAGGVRAAEYGEATKDDSLPLRLVLNSGLDIARGANLTMLGQLKMAPGLDIGVVKRGESMLEAGVNGLLDTLSGPDLLEDGNLGDSDPARADTRMLAAALTQVAGTLYRVELPEITPDTAAMHYFNILINEAMQSALEGARLMVMQHHDDEAATVRGRTMIDQGRQAIIEIMGSKSMSEMHSREAGKMAAMGLTHKLTGQVLRVLDLLDNLVR